MDVSRESLVKIVEDLDKASESQELRPDEITVRQDAQQSIQEFNQLEEISWRQKSRVNWLKEGDKNTKFFHQVSGMGRRVNYIGKIRRSGRAFESLHKIKEEVTQFYEDLYKSYASVRPKLDGLSFPSISSDTRSWWERKFEEDEVRRALEECDGDKAPGPDGFNFSFIKAR